MSLHKKHFDLLDAVNHSKTDHERQLNLSRLYGFRDCLESIGHARYVSECDYYYLDQGIDRPMCAGVFLDWTPSEEKN